jgi:hypothetical protein
VSLASLLFEVSLRKFAILRRASSEFGWGLAFNQATLSELRAFDLVMMDAFMQSHRLEASMISKVGGILCNMLVSEFLGSTEQDHEFRRICGVLSERRCQYLGAMPKPHMYHLLVQNLLHAECGQIAESKGRPLIVGDALTQLYVQGFLKQFLEGLFQSLDTFFGPSPEITMTGLDDKALELRLGQAISAFTPVQDEGR